MADYLMRLAGLGSGRRRSRTDLEAEVQDVRKLIMRSERWFLRDAFHNLLGLAADDRLLIAERFEAGRSIIDGCVAFTTQRLGCADPATGQKIVRRANLLRLLAVRECQHRRRIALRLTQEANLRGTIRALYDNIDEPAVVGTVGVIISENDRALQWARRLGDRVRIVAPSSSVVGKDAALSALRDFAESTRAAVEDEHSYRFVIANRRALLEAARLNRGGSVPGDPDPAGLRFYYDLTDPFGDEIVMAAENLNGNNPRTLNRLGLGGDPLATVWGPPEVAAMRLESGDGGGGGGGNRHEISE